jgi:hypothetical protein
VQMEVGLLNTKQQDKLTKVWILTSWPWWSMSVWCFMDLLRGRGESGGFL